MEYNKTKRGLEKAAAVLGIIVASLYIIIAIMFLIQGIAFASGVYNYYIWNYEVYPYEKVYMDNSFIGAPMFIMGLCYLAVSILMLVFSIKLVKSPFLPNGQMKKRQGTRIWVLVLAILCGNFVIMGLMIAVLCLKDFKQPKPQPAINQQNNPNTKNQYANVQVTNNQNEFLEFYSRIQEVKKLKSLDIIDDITFKKAIAKIVLDITKENK